MLDENLLKKYELNGVFRKQGTHSFFLINIEPILYLMITSIATFAVLSVWKARILRGQEEGV